MNRHRRTGLAWLILGLAAGAGLMGAAAERETGVLMLRRAAVKVADEYFDPTLRGFPLTARCAEAEQRIAKAESNAQIFRIIGQVFMDFGDSHTIFIPPARTVRVHYGWVPMVVGDACFVRWVAPKSDAAKKGLAVGDRIASINGIPANRATLWKLQYLFNALDLQGGLRLVVESPAGATRQLDVMAEVKPDAKTLDLAGSFAAKDISRLILNSQTDTERHASAFAEVGDTLVWRLPSFDGPPSTLGDGLVRVPHAKSVIIDLRGNSGGYEDTMKVLVGAVFDRDVTLGVVQERTKKRPLEATPARFPFTGLLIVLVDAESASAAEIVARVVQLENRGIVIGDRTEGMVQTAMVFDESVGASPVVPFWVGVSVGAFIMRDGRPLENVGVSPDLPVRPTGADLAAGRDPVLAFALAQTGHKLTAEAAGKLLPPDRRDEPVD